MNDDNDAYNDILNDLGIGDQPLPPPAEVKLVLPELNESLDQFTVVPKDVAGSDSVDPATLPDSESPDVEKAVSFAGVPVDNMKASKMDRGLSGISWASMTPEDSMVYLFGSHTRMLEIKEQMATLPTETRMANLPERTLLECTLKLIPYEHLATFVGVSFAEFSDYVTKPEPSTEIKTGERLAARMAVQRAHSILMTPAISVSRAKELKVYYMELAASYYPEMFGNGKGDDGPSVPQAITLPGPDLPHEVDNSKLIEKFEMDTEPMPDLSNIGQAGFPGLPDV